MASMSLPVRTAKRSFLGRSRKGCLLCRARHIKCDGAFPCRNCEKGGRMCPGNVVRHEDRGILIKGLSAASERQRGDGLETRTFLHFVKAISPQFCGYYDPEFWRSALPMAQDHEQVYDAMLAVATLYFLPMSDITDLQTLRKAVPAIIQNRYQEAQEWYNRSVQQSLISVSRDSQSVASIRLLLLTTIFYLFAEVRQAHLASLEQLYRTAFSIIHSARVSLIVCKDTAILSAIARLCDLASSSSVNGTAIPRTHWRSAIAVGLSIAADIGASGLYQLQFEVYNIQYDIDSITSQEYNSVQDTDINDHGLSLRIQQWEHAVAQYEMQPGLSPMVWIHLARLRCFFPVYKTRWTIFQKAALNQHADFVVDRRLFIKPINQLVEYYELMLRLAHNPPFSGPVPLYLLEMVWIPASICAVWHCRTISMVSRCTDMLDKFRVWGQDRFLNTIVRYLEILQRTDYEMATEVELALFAGKPKISLLWPQCHMISHHLLRRSGQSSLSNQVVDSRTGWITA